MNRRTENEVRYHDNLTVVTAQGQETPGRYCCCRQLHEEEFIDMLHILFFASGGFETRIYGSSLF